MLTCSCRLQVLSVLLLKVAGFSDQRGALLPNAGPEGPFFKALKSGEYLVLLR